jgi:hypothetical protein
MKNQSSRVEYRFFLVCDGTASMGTALWVLSKAISEFLAVAAVIGLEIRVCYYRDYDEGRPLGGYVITPRNASYENMRQLVDANAYPSGGGGIPEAQKTAFEILLRDELEKNDDVMNVIVHFTDAPPHPDTGKLDEEGRLERMEFEQRGWHHDDWKGLCARLASVANVITFSRDNSYESMGVNLGEPYPTCQGLMDMVFTMIGLSNLESSAARYARLSHMLPGLDLDYIVKSMDKFRLIEIFKKVLRDCPQAIPTNPILGKAWRWVCTMKRNPEVEVQVQALQDALSNAISKLPKQTGDALRKWVEESYNKKAEIDKLVSDVWVEGGPMLYMPTPVVIARDTVLNLTRECKSGPEIVSMMGLCKMGKIEGLSPVDGGSLQCIPLVLGPKNVFEVLPSLVCEGTSFSRRGSLIFAALSHRCAPLQALSEEHLCNNMGWVDHSLKEGMVPNIPENFSPGFLKLLCTVPVQSRDRLLGADTSQSLQRFEALTRIRCNLDAVVKYTCQRDPSARWKEFAVPDHKFLCKSCGIFRSNTNRAVFTPPTCGLCHYIATNTDVEDFTLDEAKARVETATESLITRCRSCNHWYAVTCVDHINVAPKCHDCRVGNRTTYSNVCGKCTRAFVCPTPEGLQPDYCCAECTSGQIAVVQKETVAASVLRETPELWAAVGIDQESGEALRSMTMQQLLTTEVSAPQNEATAMPSLTVGRVSVVNSPEIALEVVNTLLAGDGKAVCECCCEITPCSDMDVICGNASCSVRACGSCIRQWYGEFKQGSVVYPAHVHCPYCKLKPKGYIVSRYAGHMRALHGANKVDWNRAEHEYLLWCNTCNKIATFAPKGECGDAVAPNVSGRTCAACQAVAAPVVDEQEEDVGVVHGDDTRLCPTGCGRSIFKDGGCDHITCPCGVYICWNCMKTFDTSDECYEHMWDDCTW